METAVKMDAKAKVDLSWPRAKEAREYLMNHKVMELLNNMTAQLIYHRPDAPKAFLVQFLEELDAGQGGTYDLPALFDETNTESIFGMLDPTTTGVITLIQYKEAMATLGITEFDPNPSGSEVNRISADTFMLQAKRGLVKSAATFKL